MANYSINWDETNSPKSFLWAWAVSQVLLSSCFLLVKAHFLPSMALGRPGNAPWLRIIGFAILAVCITSVSLWLQVLVNAIWHRTKSSTYSADINESVPPAFGGSFEKLDTLNAIEIRDEIQWKKIFLTTTCMATILASLVVMF